MSDPREVGGIRQQIGEILGTVRSLSAQMDQQRDDMRRQDERVTTELRRVGDEQGRTTNTIQMRLEQITAQVRELDERARAITGELTGLRGVVEKLKAPVDELMTIRNRIVAYVAVLTTIGAVVWYVLGPLAKTAVTTFLTGKP